MTCKEAIEKLAEYLDSELTPNTVTDLESHLAICAPCRGYLATYRRSVDILGKLDRADLPESLRARLRSLIGPSTGA